MLRSYLETSTRLLIKNFSSNSTNICHLPSNATFSVLRANSWWSYWPRWWVYGDFPWTLCLLSQASVQKWILSYYPSLWHDSQYKSAPFRNSSMKYAHVATLQPSTLTGDNQDLLATQETSLASGFTTKSLVKTHSSATLHTFSAALRLWSSTVV